MELQEVTDKILKCITMLDIGIEAMREAGEKKAIAEAEYDVEMAKTLIGLKNGKSYTLADGFTIESPPASIMEKLAKGILGKQKLAMGLADTEWTRIRLKMDSIMSSMNALQSIKKHLDVV